MREDLMREVWLELENQQRQNEETERNRREEIRAGYPEIGALMEKREQMIRGSLQQVLRGEVTAEDLPARMETVSAEIRGALRAKGLPEDYLAPVYACPLCKDTGYVGETLRKECVCVQKRYQARMRREIGLPADDQETFEHFNLNLFPNEKMEGAQYSQREAMGVIWTQCEKWANSYPIQSPRDLVLSGKSGLGKTFLLHAMANRLMDRGHPVMLLSAYRFVEAARKSYFENDGSLEEMIGCPVLMLDDLGSEPMMQNVTIEQLFHLINERQRRDLATVISTNLNQEELKNRYTERVASRMTDRRNGLFLPIAGRDIRNGRM